MKRWADILVASLAVVVGGAFLWWQMTMDQPRVILRDTTYHVSVMRTEAELQKGLSGTDSLPTGQAMLFVFSDDAKWTMWMKDMKYPIDIVWLDANANVVYTVKKAQPSSYPKTFGPVTDSRYVIELPSGTIEQTGISIGDKAQLLSI